VKNCYVLNLPEFSKVKLDDFEIISFIRQHQENVSNGNFLFYTSASKIFKKEFLDLLFNNFGLKFTHVTVFHKQKNGGIHLDSGVFNATDPVPYWSINWNIINSAIYNFWDFHDMNVTEQRIHEHGKLFMSFKTIKEPKEKYLHLDKNPVLFNATLPHQVLIPKEQIGQSRYAVALRTDYPMMQWNNAVTVFEKSIITDKNIQDILIDITSNT
jgi:hypothetical protein